MGRLVLVHGAWHGAWCWERVAGPLRENGHTVIATELPFAGLAADTATVQADVDRLALDGPVVVCGHSYGGAVMTGLRRTGLAHVVCIAGYLLGDGESVFDAGSIDAPPTELGTALVRGDDGLTTLDPARAAAALYADCPAEVTVDAIARLRPMRVSGMGGVPPHPVWHDVPSTYVVCAQDRAVDPALQRDLAIKATHVVEWPTSHSPFLSRPDLAVDLLHTLLGTPARG